MYNLGTHKQPLLKIEPENTSKITQTTTSNLPIIEPEKPLAQRTGIACAGVTCSQRAGRAPQCARRECPPGSQSTGHHPSRQCHQPWHPSPGITSNQSQKKRACQPWNHKQPISEKESIPALESQATNLRKRECDHRLFSGLLVCLQCGCQRCEGSRRPGTSCRWRCSSRLRSRRVK